MSGFGREVWSVFKNTVAFSALNASPKNLWLILKWHDNVYPVYNFPMFLQPMEGN
jgi:hypothetical protein